MTKKPNMSRRSGRRGVTLIEAVLYISIALALIVGGLVFYRQASFASDMNSMNRLMSATVTEVRVIAGEIPVGTTLVGTVFERILIARQSIPSAHLDMTKPAGERIRNPFGGTISSNLTTAPDGGTTRFVGIVVTEIPVAACARLVASSAAGQTSFTTNLLSGQSRDNQWPPVGAENFIPGQTLSATGAGC